MTRERALWRLMPVLAATVVLAVPAAVYAAPPHPPGEEEVGANNLSVPALFVPSTAGSPFAGTCTAWDDSLDPLGEKGVLVDGVLEHPDYYVQGDDTWQSDCATQADHTVTAAAEWGDNLTNAPLKAGTPIRTEIGFLADAAAYPMPGYSVVKLDPALLDRESHYGTLGNEVSPFPEVRVWNSGVTLDIRSTDSATVVADSIPFAAEVNSTGRVVYGYNWQKPQTGQYTITVHTPTIALSSADAGVLSDTNADGQYDTVKLGVSVGNKGGGGSGGGGRPHDPPGGPGH